MSGGTEDFWKVKADDQEFWDKYVSTRPVYSQNFYEEMFGYHNQHSPDWRVAHDVGCGAGQLTAKLAERFEHVVGSDCQDTHLAVAKRNLASFQPGRISFTHSKGEDMVQHHPAESVDLLVCSEAMPIMDGALAMSSFNTLLKPGGTLVLTFYGRPTFTEPGYLEAQSTLDDIMDYHWKKAFRGDGKPIEQDRLSVLEHVANNMASWLDYVDFDPNLWIDVKRIKRNPKATLPFFGEEATGSPVVTVNNIKPTEVVQEVDDPTWWRNLWTITDLRNYFRVLFPDFPEVMGEEDDELAQLYNTLESGMGGHGAIRAFTWPTVLVLATKR